MVPLSEDERRILAEIERGLHDEDPEFARGLRHADPRASEFRRVRIGILSFVVGLGILFAFFVSRLLIVGVFAFGAMVAGIVLTAGAVGNLASFWRRGFVDPRERVGHFLRDWKTRVRDRYRRP